jgi:hypothetical protein
MDENDGPSSRFKKKKNEKRRHDDHLVVAVERKATRPKNNSPKSDPPTDHFEKLLEAPCTHHEMPVNHTLKDYRLMKNYVIGALNLKMVDPPKKAAPPPNNDDDEGAGYPSEDDVVHMIFGRTPVRPSRR